MSVSFAGESLLLEDPGRDLQVWLARNLSLLDAELSVPPVAYRDNRSHARGPYRSHVGLPLANWEFRPRWKLNTLWWPSGASRWATGLFLTDETTLAKITAKVDLYSGAYLILASDDSHQLSVYMHLLPPRRLSLGNGGDELYLLPLVDKRFFWQFQDAGLFQVTSDTTWGDAIGTLAMTMGIALYSGAISNYAQPDPEELTRRYENAAVLLDAMAWSVGQRVVAEVNGNFSMLTPGQSKIRADWNAEVLADALMSGGGHRNVVPESVRVVFPRYRNGAPKDNGDVYYVSVSAPAGMSAVPGTCKTFFDTAAANFREVTVFRGVPEGSLEYVPLIGDDESSPYNSSDLYQLASQIASDYYSYLEYATDSQFAGVAAWTPTGFDDAIWWHVGYQYPPHEQENEPAAEGMTEGNYAVWTRVTSLPYNWGFTELLHQFPAAGSSSSSSSSTSSSSSIHSSASSSLSSSEKPARFIEFTLIGSLSESGASANASIDRYYGDGGDPGPQRTVYNKSATTAGGYMFSGDAGHKGMAVYDDQQQKYRVWQMECP